ncbi:MAG: protein kinase [Cyanobacteria bacterium P01_F01_bin.150]
MSAICCRQGHQNSSDDRFCRFCGEPLTVSASPASLSPGISSPEAFPWAGAVNNRAIEGAIVGDRYRIRQQLGHGGFGKTYLAEDINRFNESCVLKEFAPQVEDPSNLKKAGQLFEREAGVLYQLRHAQIPRFRELLRVETGGQLQLFLVQDYVRGHNYQELLDQRQQRGEVFSEQEILQLLWSVLPVLGYIHQKGVIHRDISPDNLMRRDEDHLPVLIDFGGVKQAAISVISALGQGEHVSGDVAGGSNIRRNGPASVTIVGKQGYAPYEQMVAGEVEPHNDFYALAVTVLVLLTGQSPHYLLDANSPAYWQTQLSLSPRLSRVLRKMLSVYPSDRYTSAQAILSTLFPDAASYLDRDSVSYGSANLSYGADGESMGYAGANSSYNSKPAEPQPSYSAAPTPTLAVAPGLSPSASLSPAPGSAELASKSVPPPVNPGAKSTPFPISSSPASIATTRAATKSSRRRFPSVLLAILIVIGVGTTSAWVGSNLPRWVTEWNSQRQDSDDNANGNDGNNDGLEPSSQFSAAEQQRKADLGAERDRLQVNNQFLVQLTDASFYSQYPQQQGRALTANPEDAEWREKWDAIAAQWLTQLESLLNANSRSNLGRYSKANRDQWKQAANRINVSSRALYALTDMEFFAAFPDQQDQKFINQPIGQIWHGIADANLRQWQSGATLDKIQFSPGAYSKTLNQTLQPGQGYTYLLNAQEGQILRLNIDGPRTLLSLYVPRPTGDTPFLLEDSLDKTWSGQLPQSGFYEIVVMMDHPALSNQASSEAKTVSLRVSVDNVLAPVEPEQE